MAEGNKFVINSRYNTKTFCLGNSKENIIFFKGRSIPIKHIINKYNIIFRRSLFFLSNSLLSSQNNIFLINFPFSVSNPTPMTKPTASFFD